MESQTEHSSAPADDLIVELGTFSGQTQGIHPGGTEGPDCMPAGRTLCP